MPYNTKSCGQPLEAHIMLVMVALLDGGFNLSCKESYAALVEVAETIRKVMDYEPHEVEPQLQRVMVETFQRAVDENEARDAAPMKES
jgi:hypothetical protein